MLVFFFNYNFKSLENSLTHTVANKAFQKSFFFSRVKTEISFTVIINLK